MAIVKRSAKQSHKRASIKILHLDGVFEGRNKARMRYPVLIAVSILPELKDRNHAGTTLRWFYTKYTGTGCS